MITPGYNSVLDIFGIYSFLVCYCTYTGYATMSVSKFQNIEIKKRLIVSIFAKKKSSSD